MEKSYTIGSIIDEWQVGRVVLPFRKFVCHLASIASSKSFDANLASDVM